MHTWPPLRALPLEIAPHDLRTSPQLRTPWSLAAAMACDPPLHRRGKILQAGALTLPRGMSAPMRHGRLVCMHRMCLTVQHVGAGAPLQALSTIVPHLHQVLAKASHQRNALACLFVGHVRTQWTIDLHKVAGHTKEILRMAP